MPNRPQRDEKGRLLPGHKMATGRPRGARSRLSEAVLNDLETAWETSGVVQCYQVS